MARAERSISCDWLRLPVALVVLLMGLPLTGCEQDTEVLVAPAPPPPGTATGVRILPVPGVPRIEAGPPDVHGARATVACSTCHSMKEPVASQRSGATLASFHQGLEVSHASLTCLSCHNEKNYDTLRLADGRSIAYEQVQELCAQCHGTQARNYEHGAHGGMSGYWDTTRGEQVRNQCTHCHDPHDPKFPHMRPKFKARDRFLVPMNTGSAGAKGEVARSGEGR